MDEINWKCGFEIELLAPSGSSRQDLAQAIADQYGGQVQRCFYPQSEPSAVPGTPVFENLILGFDAFDKTGALLVRCVDDLTIRADLNHNAEGLDGWYRIVSDDIRLLRLIQAQCNPDADRMEVLDPVAKLYGTKPVIEDGLVRLADKMSSPIALAAPLPGERERPCEIITPPLDVNHERYLAQLLSVAERLGFTVPVEAALHIHFDAAALQDTPIFCRLVEVMSLYGPQLRKLVQTNPRCIRLAPVPSWLTKLTKRQDFRQMPWPDASKVLQDRELSKYCDFNFLNLVHDLPGKSTFEVRIFPGTMNVRQITEQARLFEAILLWCCDNPSGGRLPHKLHDFLRAIGFDCNRS